MTADEDPRLKRLRIRSWRRGTKEMDLILGTFADRHLAELSVPELEAFEALLEENDPDLYRWVSGQAEAPATHADFIERLATTPINGPD